MWGSLCNISEKCETNDEALQCESTLGESYSGSYGPQITSTLHETEIKFNLFSKNTVNPTKICYIAKKTY